MRLKIVNVNFTTKENWLFKLTDENCNNFFIMQSPFYKDHKLSSPISKKELDFYDKGCWINAIVEQIDGYNVVVGLK